MSGKNFGRLFNRRARWAMASACALTLGLAPIQPAFSAGKADNGANWSAFGRTDTEDHFSPLTQINDKNIARLGLAWSHDLETFDSYTAPLAVDGVIYFAVGHSILHAMDARNGEVLWTYDPEVAKHAGARMRAGWGVRGIAYKDGVVYTGTRDGRLLAVNAKDGTLLWSVETLDEAEGGYITGPPWIAGDNVVIGFGGADYSPVRGYVTAYNVKTGKKAWRFHIVPGDPAKGFENKAMEMAAKTWTGEWWKFGGGGTVYHAMAYDKQFNRIYLGTGNGWPWNQKIRSPGGGDNLFLSSIVALDATTGEYVWHYQTDPGNTWDFNNAMDIQLTELTIDGQKRPVLIHAPKNGFFYVLDRRDGKLLSAEKFAKANWADKIDLETGRPVINPEARFPDGKPFVMYPLPLGAHGVQSMSYSPKTGLTYIPVTEGGRVFVDPPNLANWQYKPGMFVNTGLGAPPPDIKVPPPTSALLAWDVAKAKPAWRVELTGLQNGGTIATAGNLVFQGDNQGKFNAYAADDGRKLWSFDAQNGILGNAITYKAGGKQYVTILTGWRSSFAGKPNWDYEQQRRRVLTFVLDGKAILPPADRTDIPVLDDASFTIDPDKAKIGAGVYNSSCVICHGAGMVAGGAAPDLRKSSMPMDADTFRAVVHDGILMERGMPNFDILSDGEIEGLRHYIRQRARETVVAK
ncbi:PQQ-dependent dehydrogenase, methanol/ethanol family [Niveispirillum irakense]|uniref:PQQ-dependent dehydrogenase, methanol/ethanol family n=1 Tax=Niveispirillum irakense TaxID=34011 RepID=UPI00041F4EE0|nr:PQQ-dependent dehydrogenase, methanol/ethanol family [Niveispirillum irakense]